MSSGPVVANSSPLIALGQIGHLQLLDGLFSTVVIPPAVAAEARPGLSLPPWVAERALAQPIGPQILRASLGRGESEAISLAIEADARWVILDDRPARRLAQALGLPVIGTLGILLASKRKGLLPAVQPCLESLTDHGFRISPDLYDHILADAGEGP